MPEISDQPPPERNNRVQITDLVIADLEERRRVGIERYGTPLQPHNGRDALVDLYQELQDGLLYIRQEIEERSRPADVQATIDELARGAYATYWELRRGGWAMAEMPSEEAVRQALGITEERLLDRMLVRRAAGQPPAKA